MQAVLFDLDNTVYPAASGLMQAVGQRITGYVTSKLGISEDEAHALRDRYFRAYGTTLRGLIEHHQVDYEEYLEHVHTLDYGSFLVADTELDRLLGELEARKAIFTNATAEHAKAVLGVLGIAHHFDPIFDIRFMELRSKPDPYGYRKALDVLGVSGSQAVLIEDTAQNLPPAKELGMRTLLVGRQPHQAADHLVPDLRAALLLLGR